MTSETLAIFVGAILSVAAGTFVFTQSGADEILSSAARISYAATARACNTALAWREWRGSEPYPAQSASDVLKKLNDEGLVEGGDLPVSATFDVEKQRIETE